MNLVRCHILGFGRLANLPLIFGDGLSVVFAPNEGGKSTLQRFLTALLYGQLRPDIKIQRRLESWVEQYKPWRGSDYAGALWCRLASGRELEIHRSFGREDSRFEVRTSGGEDIARQYEIQRNGDVIFAAAHLGLTKELFESVAVVRETETADLRNRETLRDRIANLAQSGDEKLSIRLSLVKLEEALEAIGSERAPTRPYRQAMDRLQELQEEQAEFEARRNQCREWIQERIDLAGEIERLEHELRAAGRGVVEARWREADHQVRALVELDNEIHSLTGEIESLGADPDFPVHRLEELNRLVADEENVSIRLEELRGQVQEVTGRRSQAEEELQKLSSYASLHESVEPEKVTEWFVSYLSLSRQKDESQRTLNRLLTEASEIEGRLALLSPVLQDSGVDWERKARQAAEEERTASQQSMALAEKIARGKDEHIRAAGKMIREILLAVLSVLCSGAIVTAIYTGKLLPSTFWLALAGAAGAVAVVFLLTAARSRRAAQKAKQAFRTLDAELKSLQEQAQAAQGELQQAVAESGFNTGEDFLAAARQAGIDRQRFGDLTPRIHDAEQQRNRFLSEADGVYAHLKECLSRVGLSCAPGNLKAPVDALRSNMRRYAELLAGRRRVNQELETLQAEEQAVSARADSIHSRIQAVLAEGGVDSPGAFRLGCRKHQERLELSARVSSRSREFEHLRGSFTLDQWKARLDDLQAQREDSGEEKDFGAEDVSDRPCLPYLPTAEEAEEEEKRVGSLLAGKREEYARLAERVRQAFHNFRNAAEIEEDLAVAEKTAQELALNRKALSTALESIRSLARLQQEVCAPQLNRAVEERFLQICPDRYNEVKIDPDFRIQVRELETSELRGAELLSRGTQDQLYFAVRFGILDLLANSQESCPCLLDEPFVAYDNERMGAAFRVLEAEAGRRQLILFTCREDVRDLALQHGAHLVTLETD
jgi:hypothetical protein